MVIWTTFQSTSVESSVEEFAVAPVFAGKQANPDTITCEEFLMLGEDVQPAVVYWLQGNSGEVDAIDIDEYEEPVVYVVTECGAEKSATLKSKVLKKTQNTKKETK